VGGVADPLAKAELRRRLAIQRRSRRDELAAAARTLVEIVVDRLASTHATRVGIYAALPDEVDTRPLFERLRAMGIGVAFPRVSENGVLDFAEAAEWAGLQRGRLGALEPGPGSAPFELVMSDWLLVPGVAFDRAGRRLGRGGGWYDRTLRHLRDIGRRPFVVGIASAFQIVDAVPADAWDEPVDALVTELGWLDVVR
jgi:5-formyltetrahydrofolate cyclo-ligase